MIQVSFLVLIAQLFLLVRRRNKCAAFKYVLPKYLVKRKFITFTFSKSAPLWQRKSISCLQLYFNFVGWLIWQHKVNNKEPTMEIQTEDKPYSCVECNLSFQMSKDLKTHMLQHDGKKSHPCNQCGYSAISVSQLKAHMLIHSGEKPFKCTQCNYSCTTAGNLKKHNPFGQKGF